MAVTRDYAILLKKVRDTDRETNRFFMKTDFESGFELPQVIHRMQHDVLPTVDTPNLKI